MVNFGADLLSLPKARKTIGKEFGDGALLPVGCYAVQLATMVFNNERPQKITATAEFDEKGEIFYGLFRVTMFFKRIV